MKPTKLLLLTLLLITASCRKDEPAMPEPERTHSIIYRVWCYNCNVEWTNELGQMQKVFLDGEFYDRPSKTLDIGPMVVKPGFNATLKFSGTESKDYGNVTLSIIDNETSEVLKSDNGGYLKNKPFIFKWTAP